MTSRQRKTNPSGMHVIDPNGTTPKTRAHELNEAVQELSPAERKRLQERIQARIFNGDKPHDNHLQYVTALLNGQRPEKKLV